MVATASTMLPLGTKAPDFSLTDTRGGTVSLSDFQDAPTLLVMFICNHCPFVKHISEELASMAKEYQTKGVAIVGLAMDREGIKKVLPFVQKQNVNYISLIGTGKVTSDYGGIRSIPTTFVIDQKGRIVTQHVGLTERKIFESEIVALLQEG